MLFSLWESCNSTFVCPKDPSRGWHWQVWSMCRTPGFLSTAESFTWQRSHPEISWFCLHLSDFGDTQENAFGQQTMIDYKQQKNTYWYTYIYICWFLQPAWLRCYHEHKSRSVTKFTSRGQTYMCQCRGCHLTYQGPLGLPQFGVRRRSAVEEKPCVAHFAQRWHLCFIYIYSWIMIMSTKRISFWDSGLSSVEHPNGAGLLLDQTHIYRG